MLLIQGLGKALFPTQWFFFFFNIKGKGKKLEMLPIIWVRCEHTGLAELPRSSYCLQMRMLCYRHTFKALQNPRATKWLIVNTHFFFRVNTHLKATYFRFNLMQKNSEVFHIFL